MKSLMFKKLRLVFVAFLLSACSMADLLPPTAVPPPTLTPFITLTPIDTPVNTNTPRPSATATIVRIPTQDPNQPTFTPFATLPIIIDGNTATPVLPPTSVAPGPGFLSVEYSPIKIYWGNCDPNQVTVRAEVEEPDEVFSVIIFTRVRDIEKEDYTPWTNGNVMLDRGQGEFTYNLIGSQIEGHNHYLRSWVYFQLVATNIKGEEIGRTRIYEKAFDMYPCPCLTPLTGCPVATPKK